MIHIPLTQGKFALIDDEDFELVNQYKWYACKTDYGYIAMRCVRFKGRKYNIRMHRLIMNAQKGEEIDHRNHNMLDNRRSTNLRICTHIQNQYNRISQRNSSSKYKGVHWDKREKKWQAQIRSDKKYCGIGYFDNEVTAAKAYDKKALELHGEFARLNFSQLNFLDCHL